MAAKKRVSSEEGPKEGSVAEGARPQAFEQAIAELSLIVEELEEGELSLEQSLERFERGVGLARLSQARLDEAEAKVQELISAEDDRVVLRDLEEP